MTFEPENNVVLFGQTEFRNAIQHFGIKLDDRRRHMYVIGKSGMGKSELLKMLAIQDIRDGRGVCFMDPHGDPVYDLLDYIPPERVKDVIFINPADMQFPVGFNVMESVSFDQRHLVADGMMAVFKKIWLDAWSARMEYILNNTILALLEAPGSTLLGINRMLADKEYRKKIVDQVTDPEVKAFWTQEFAKYTDKFASEATAAIQNKVGQFVSNSLIRNLVGQERSTFNMREAMDQRKIILVDISKGRIGEDASRLLGAMIITKIQLAAMSRVDIPKHERADFTLIVDEFQNFATGSFANILSEARKFNLSLIVAHQYIKQLAEEVADAVFGNVGTIISFRIGAEDAELMEKEFAPEFMATDIVNLGFRQMYLKLMIDGVTSHAFSAMTMDTPKKLDQSTRDEVVEYSRTMYARPRAEVEEAIAKWRAPLEQPQYVPRAGSDRPATPRRDSPFPSQSVARPMQQPQRPQGQGSHQRPPPQSSGPRPTLQQTASLDALKGGAVGFNGRAVEIKEKPQATTTSVVSTSDDELKALIRRALNM